MQCNKIEKYHLKLKNSSISVLVDTLKEIIVIFDAKGCGDTFGLVVLLNLNGLSITDQGYRN